MPESPCQAWFRGRSQRRCKNAARYRRARAFVDVVKVVKPAVVNILRTRSGGGEWARAHRSRTHFRRFFRRRVDERSKRQRTGSNRIGIRGDRRCQRVDHYEQPCGEQGRRDQGVLSDKREFKAPFVGTDAKTDVAVLKIEATGAADRGMGRFGQAGSRRICAGGGQSFRSDSDRHPSIERAGGARPESPNTKTSSRRMRPSIRQFRGAPSTSVGVGRHHHRHLQSKRRKHGIGFPPVPSNMAHSIMDQLVQHGRIVRAAGWASPFKS